MAYTTGKRSTSVYRATDTELHCELAMKVLSAYGSERLPIQMEKDLR